MDNENRRGCLLGFPDDKGVENNKGRVGAKDGPSAFRKQFLKLGGANPVHEMMIDKGDVEIDRDETGQNHQRATAFVKEHHREHDFSLIIGGGHDYAYPHLQGVKEAYGQHFRLGCINIDAHLDLRPDEGAILSGSPFYMAIDRNVLQGHRLIEFGIQYHCNSQHLWEYAHKQEITVMTFDQLRNGKAIEEFRDALEELCESCDGVVISMDLDSIQAASAPGVSAPAPEGFTPSDLLQIIEMSGRDDNVKSLGIYELNPIYDRDDHTARLASLAAYNFCRLKTRHKRNDFSDQHMWSNRSAT